MSKSYSEALFSALKEAGVKGLRSRRSARAIASLEGQEMTLSEIKSAMTDKKQVPLAKSHDWLFFEEDDQPIIALGKGRYEVRLHFRQFVDKVSPGEMVTATFTLGLKRTRKRRSCEQVYKVRWCQIMYTTLELHNKLNEEPNEWLPDYYVANHRGIQTIKYLLDY